MSTTENDEIEPYGCCGCQPKYLQCMNNIRAHVVWRCLFGFFQGFLVSGITNVILVALETRYALSSAMSGIIASSNDIGGLLVLLPVSYFGEHRHKPQIMAAGIFIMALGSLVFACPHFVGGKYEYTVSEETMNDSSTNICQTSSSPLETCTITSQLTASPLYAMLVIGQILLGIGACPLITISFSYTDENTEPKMSSYYTGWILASFAVGLSAGYVAGGQTLRIFVDIGTVDPQSVQLTPTDPQWVGAWWIGPIVSVFLLLVIAFPFLGYPRRLPGYPALQRKRKSEAHCDGAEEVTARPGFGENIKDFPTAVFLLVKNPTFVFICLGASTEALIYRGSGVFAVKLFQQRFQANIATAGLIIGTITAPGIGLGMVLGGSIVKRFNLDCRNILRLCTCAAALTLLFAPAFLAECEEKPLAGVTTTYNGQLRTVDGLTSSCNAGCGCTTTGFEPLCVNSSVVYFSPCHAGCTNFTTVDRKKYYGNCSCLTEQSLDDLNNSLALYMSHEQAFIEPGTCGYTCVWMYVFAVMFFITLICDFLIMAPTVSAIFRCVPHKQRSLALGLQLLVVRLLGTIPGPVLLGSILDSTCQVWQDSCGETGSCWVYDIDDMAYRLITWWIVIKLFSVFFFGMASRVYKKPEKGTSSKEEA